MKTNKKELTVFALCAYAIPFLMMPLLHHCLQNGQDTSIYANAQMFYPAAGVMLAFLMARRKEMPLRFFVLHLVVTAGMLLMGLLSAAMPQAEWMGIANLVIVIASVLGWILLLTERKDKRERYGLRLPWAKHPERSLGASRCRAEVHGRSIWPIGKAIRRGLWRWC